MSLLFSRIQLFTIIFVVDIENREIVGVTRTDSFDGIPRILWDDDHLVYYQSSAIRDSILFRWDLTTDPQAYTFDGRILAAIEDNTLHVLSQAGRYELNSDNEFTVTDSEAQLYSANMSADGQLQANIVLDHIEIVDSASATIVSTIEHGISTRLNLNRVHTQWLDNNILMVLIANESPKMIFWDSQTLTTINETVLPATELINAEMYLNEMNDSVVVPNFPHQLLLFSTATGDLLAQTVVNSTGFLGMAIDPISGTVAQGENDESTNINLLVWDVATGTAEAYHVGQGFVTSLDWYPNGDILAIGDQSFSELAEPVLGEDAAGMQLWFPESDDVFLVDQIESFSGDLVMNMEWNIDGTVLVATHISNQSGQTQLVAWNRAGERLWEETLTILDYAWSNDGTRLMMIDFDFATGQASYIERDALTGTTLNSINAEDLLFPLALTAHPTADHLLAILPSNSSGVHVLNTNTLQIASSYEGSERIIVNSNVPSLAWSPDGQYLAFSVVDVENPWQPQIEIWQMSDAGDFESLIAVLDDHYQGVFIGNIQWIDNRLYALGSRGDIVIWEITDVQ